MAKTKKEPKIVSEKSTFVETQEPKLRSSAAEDSIAIKPKVFVPPKAALQDIKMGEVKEALEEKTETSGNNNKDEQVTGEKGEWDIKFALGLMGLFILINLGLTFLLGRGEETEQIASKVTTPEEVVVAEQPDVQASASIAEEAIVLTEEPAVVAIIPSSNEVTIMPALAAKIDTNQLLQILKQQ